MKNLIIGGVVLLAALSTTVPASAEWTFVTTSDNNTYFYIDWSTLRKDANIRRVWTLDDLPKVGYFGQRSEVRREEYDCNLERQRGISWTSREGPLGTGRRLHFSDDTEPWSSAPPGTVVATIMRLVCSK